MSRIKISSRTGRPLPPPLRCARRGLRAAALLALLAAGPVHAQSAPPLDTGALYQEALQSIAEGRKNDASATLNQVIALAPLHAGAWLDLAQIQCALGHAAEAERLLRAIELRFDPPPGIVALIKETRATGCPAWRPLTQASVGLARGIDQNVNQGASDPFYTVMHDGIPVTAPLSPEFRPRHDQYTLVNADLARDLTPNGALGFAQLQWRRNDALHDYDSASLTTGAEGNWRMARWSLRASASAGVVQFGGRLFQRVAQVQMRAGPPLRLPGETQFDLVGNFTHLDYRTLDNFDANTAELKAQFSYRGRSTYASLVAGLLRDHALAARPGGDRRGWSAGLQGRGALGASLTGEASLSYQGWASSAVYAPGTIDIVRHQRMAVARAALTYPWSRSTNLVLEARQVWNRENIPIFQYNTRLLQLSWQWTGL